MSNVKIKIKIAVFEIFNGEMLSFSGMNIDKTEHFPYNIPYEY